MTRPTVALFVGLILGLAWAGVGDFGDLALTAVCGFIGYVVGRALDAGVADDINEYLNRRR
jgi:hypothetical protein